MNAQTITVTPFVQMLIAMLVFAFGLWASVVAWVGVKALDKLDAVHTSAVETKGLVQGIQTRLEIHEGQPWHLGADSRLRDIETGRVSRRQVAPSQEYQRND